MNYDPTTEQFEGLPLRLAWIFLRDNGLENKVFEIRDSPDRLGSLHYNLKRAKVISLLDENKLLDQFITKYWNFGNTSDGQGLIRRYRGIFSKWINREASQGDTEDENSDETTAESNEETSFALEQHLRDYLVNNLSFIEPGLIVYKDKNDREGIEYPIDENGRRVDILAIDKNGVPVILELKVSRGHERAIGQALYYRNRVKHLFGTQKARIVIVAREITPELKMATADLDGVELFQYKLSFKLENI